MRNLMTLQILAKYEGHQYAVSHLAFGKNSYVFGTSANNECLLWNPRDALKASTLIEVSQPDKILDLASSELIT